MPILRKEHFEFGHYGHMGEKKWVDAQSKAIIDLPKLIKTRMVIEANSGGGKSWLMRLLMELFFGYVQQIVIDPEGEFSSLREKFGFILATADRDEDGVLLGDIEADPHTADVLAHTVLKTNASIVVDISELSQDVRRTYVKNFVTALVDSPRELWHPAIIWLDEGHDYAPEAGKGIAVSLPAIKDLASKGRKRGQCLVIATQRLSKLSKDVVAECRNYMIGLTNYLDDQDRVGEILGFTTGKDGKEMRHELRELEPGVFWASGSVFNSGLREVKVGVVQTHHPEATGDIKYKPPPTPESIKPLLETFHEIPVVKKRNLDERTELLAKVHDMQGTIQSLSMKNQNLEREKANSTISPEKLKEIQEEWFAKGQRTISEKFNQAFKEMQVAWTKTRNTIESIGRSGAAIDSQAKQFLEIGFPQIPELLPLPEVKTAALWNPIARPAVQSRNSATKAMPPASKAPAGNVDVDPDSNLGRAERAILKFLALREGKEFTKTQLAAMTGYSPTSGGFNNSLSKLKTAGLIKWSNQRASLISERLNEVIQILGDEYNAPEQNTLEEWLNKLGLAPRKIYEVLYQNTGSSFTKDELSEKTGYQVTSGGFNNAISNLITLGLAERVDGRIQFNQELIGV